MLKRGVFSSSRIEIHGFIKFGQTTGEKPLQAAYRQIPSNKKTMKKTKTKKIAILETSGL